jgi:hypothetical protein
MLINEKIEEKMKGSWNFPWSELLHCVVVITPLYSGRLLNYNLGLLYMTGFLASSIFPGNWTNYSVNIDDVPALYLCV